MRVYTVGMNDAKRDVAIVLGLALVAVVIGVLIFLYGRSAVPPFSPSAAAGDTPTAAAVPFTELARGAHSTVTARANYLVTSPGQLAQLWKMVDAAGQAPLVDFSSDSVIAVFAGTEPTAGYAIAVSKVTDGQVRLVTVTLTAPDSTCILAQSKTAPYQIVELPKTALPLTHEDVATTTNCL